MQFLVGIIKYCDILTECLAHFSLPLIYFISLILLSLNCGALSNWRKISLVSHTHVVYLCLCFVSKLFRITLSFFSKTFSKNKFVKSVRALSLNIKTINSMPKYPHISKTSAYILKIFAMIFLLSIQFFISFGMCSTPKLSKYVILLPSITIYHQSYPLSYHWFIIIKTY